MLHTSYREVEPGDAGSTHGSRARSRAAMSHVGNPSLASVSGSQAPPRRSRRSRSGERAPLRYGRRSGGRT